MASAHEKGSVRKVYLFFDAEQFEVPRPLEPTKLHYPLIYPSPDTSLEHTIRLPADLAADLLKPDQTIRATVYDDVFAAMSLGCLVFGGAFVFYVLFGIQ